jgi:hypothetical protein
VKTQVIHGTCFALAVTSSLVLTATLLFAQPLPEMVAIPFAEIGITARDTARLNVVIAAPSPVSAPCNATIEFLDGQRKPDRDD